MNGKCRGCRLAGFFGAPGGQGGDDGVADTNEIKRQMLELIEQEPLARIDYVSIADGNTLEELGELHQPAMISLAVHIGKTRLIDNIVI